MKRPAITLTATLFALGMFAGAAAAVPTTVHFSARVSNAGGPIDGAVDLGFQLYDAPAAGTLVWEEAHPAVTADHGLIFVDLGSQDPLDGSVFTGGSLYLQVVVNGTPQSPRVAIGAVPYATRAALADSAATLGTLAPGDVAPAGHSHSYAPLGHAHAATDIVSGTLDPARFSAYGDLQAEGRLDNTSSIDLLTRGQSDDRYAVSSHSHPAPSLSCSSATAASATVGPGQLASATATCSSGVVTGGGCHVTSGLTGYRTITDSFAPNSSTWYCRMQNTHTSTSMTFETQARCCNL